MYEGDDHIPLHRRTNHDRELVQQPHRVFWFERQCACSSGGELVAVAQQEEQHIQHHEETHHEIERVLADGEYARGDGLAAAAQRIDHLALNRGKVRHAIPLERAAQPLRQHIDDGLEIGGDLDLAGLEPLIERSGFMRDGNAQHRHGQQHAHQNDDERAERSPTFAPATDLDRTPLQR